MKKTSKLLAWALAAAFSLNFMAVHAMAAAVSNPASTNESETAGGHTIVSIEEAASYGIHAEKRYMFYTDNNGRNTLRFVYFFSNIGNEDVSFTWDVIDADGNVAAYRPSSPINVPAKNKIVQYYNDIIDCDSKLVKGAEYTYRIKAQYGGQDKKMETIWNWEFIHDPSIVEIPDANLGYGLNKTHTGYEAAAKLEYDVTYSVRIHEAVTMDGENENIYLYENDFWVEAGTSMFIPFSGTWKIADDESSRYEIDVKAMVDFNGIQRLYTWAFSTDFIPVGLGLD
jgi:hypothetical protein